jgi:4,4'-diaponeurosporenoate glycosyltransferase
MAFGPCLLTSADDYQRVGGHAAVRGEVIEDVRLAQRYRDEGLAVRGFRGGDAVRFRMYPGGLRQLLDGWTKNIAAGASTTRFAPLVGTIAWIAANILATFRFASASVGWALGAADPPSPAVAVTYAVVAAELWWLLHKVGRFRWWAAVLFPLPLAAFLVVFARSAVAALAHRPVTWRDRQVVPS